MGCMHWAGIGRVNKTGSGDDDPTRSLITRFLGHARPRRVASEQFPAIDHAEFERSMIQQRIRAGVDRAKAKGVKFGRPKVSATVEREVRHRLGSGEGMLKIARGMKIGTGVVQRIKKEMTRIPA